MPDSCPSQAAGSCRRLTACHLALLLTVLAPAVEAAEPSVALHLWDVPQKGRGNAISVSRRRIFEAFCREHPRIQVQALVPLGIEGPAAWGQQFLAVAGGVAPDVFLLPLERLGDFRDQGFLHPLSDFLADFEKRHGRPYHGINALYQMWNVCHDDGVIDCVPYNEYFQTIYCVKDVFARAGLPFRGPEDWDELYAMARRLHWDPAKEPGADPNQPRIIGVRILAGTNAGWNYMPYVWAAGGDVVQAYYPRGDQRIPVPAPPMDFRKAHVGVFNSDVYERKRVEILGYLRRHDVPTDYTRGDLEWRMVTNSPQAMEAFKFQRRLVHQPWLRNGDHEFDITPQMFRDRKAVDPITGDTYDLDDPDVRKRIYHGVSDALNEHTRTRAQYRWDRYAMWMGTIQEAEAWDSKTQFATPFPSRPGAPPASYVGGGVLAVNATIASSEEPGRRNVEAIRKAAWRYIEFVTGPEAQRLKMTTFLEYGLEEHVKPALLIEGGYADLLERIPPQRRSMWDYHAAAARAQPHLSGFNEITSRELAIPLTAMITDAPDRVTGAFKRDLQQLMDASCQRVNTLVLGRMPESELRRRARIGWVVFVVIAAGMILAGYGVVRLAMRMQSAARDSEGFGVGGHPARRRLYAWALLLPAVGTILVWSYYPLAKGLVMAFQDYRIVGDSTYVGLRNFVEVVSAFRFWRYLLQSFQYMGMLVGIGFCVPIALAILLHEIPRGKVIYRVIYYLPAVTTGLVTLFLWKHVLYQPSEGGVLNRLILWMNKLPVPAAAMAKTGVLIGALALAAGLLAQCIQAANSSRHRAVAGFLGSAVLGTVLWLVGAWLSADGAAGIGNALWSPFDFSAQKFLYDPDLAMLWCVIPPIWATSGPACLIYLAALKGIPEAQYEAADIDGAGVWKKLWNVTIPNLKALIIISFVGAVIAGFKEASNIFVMTGGGPEDSTMTIGLEIWYNAFLYLNFGRATAMAWIMGALLVGFTLNQLRILNKLQFRSTAVEQELGVTRPG